MLPPLNLSIMSNSHGVNTPTGYDENGNLIYETNYINGKDASREANQQMLTNAVNMRMAWQENQWNLEQWNRENEYNSPSSKLQRLKDAGLNPAFYDLEGVANASQLTSANLANQQSPQYIPPSQTFGNIMGGISSAIDSSLAPGKLAVEAMKTDAEIKKLQTSAGVDRATVDQIAETLKLTRKQAEEIDSKIRLNNATIDLTSQKVKESIQSVGESKTRAMLNETMDKYYFTKAKNESAATQKQLQLSDKQMEQIDSVIRKTAEETLLTGEKITSERLDQFAKDIELVYKEAGLQNQYDKDRASIIDICYGKLAPLYNFVWRTVANDDHNGVNDESHVVSKGVNKGAEAINRGTDASGNNQVGSFLKRANTSTSNPNL